jgi:hypothetical protein
MHGWSPGFDVRVCIRLKVSQQSRGTRAALAIAPPAIEALGANFEVPRVAEGETP